MNSPEPMPSCLRHAIAVWERDMPISLTLAVRLMGLGYDVDSLEQHYRP